MILAIDPGIRGCGAAVFSGKKLLSAQYVSNPATVYEKDSGFRVYCMAREIQIAFPNLESPQDTLICEFPQIYREAKQQKKDPNDLPPLAAIDGAIAGLLNMVPEFIFPHAWKGSLNADACIVRIRCRLTEEEWGQIEFPKNTCADCLDFERALTPCRKSTCLAHNVFDSIGIGLKHLGRLEAVKVYAR